MVSLRAFLAYQTATSKIKDMIRPYLNYPIPDEGHTSTGSTDSALCLKDNVFDMPGMFQHEPATVTTGLALPKSRPSANIICDDHQAKCANTTQDTVPTQDTGLWYDDGDLILVARNVEFRVYKGPLAAQSLVFRDMFSFPQPAEDHPTNGVAVVHVSDSPEDLRHFLRPFVGEPPSLEPIYAEISAHIRLGHKYQCDKLVQHSIAYLKRYFVDDWDNWWKVTSYDPPHFRPIERIGVVNLARLAGAYTLLPVALMYCCMLGTEIADGFTREDGTWEQLTPEDLARCFVGRARLLEATFVAVQKVFEPVCAQGCAHPERCRTALMRLSSGIWASERLMEDIRGLRWETAYVDAMDGSISRTLCVMCYGMLGRSERQGQQHREIFRRLPEMMGVAGDGWGGSLGSDVATSTA